VTRWEWERRSNFEWTSRHGERTRPTSGTFTARAMMPGELDFAGTAVNASMCGVLSASVDDVEANKSQSRRSDVVSPPHAHNATQLRHNYSSPERAESSIMPFFLLIF
jgi:hypothetical protein